MSMLSPERIQQIKSEADELRTNEDLRLGNAYDLIEELVLHAETVEESAWAPTIICPHCKHDFGNSSDAMYHPNILQMRCSHCAKWFITYQHIEYKTEEGINGKKHD